MYQPPDADGNTRSCGSTADRFDKLQPMAADSERSEMLSMLSHDIRTPLSVIRLNAEMLLESEGVLDESCRAALESIMNAAHNASVLMDDFVTLTRLETGGIGLNPGPAPLTVLVQYTLSSLRHMVEESAATILTEMPDDLPDVLVDVDRFGRVLTNVLANALKHSQRGVSVRIAARGEDACVVLEISDDGPGIPREDLPYVFNRRLSRARGKRVEGHGLGLMIVKTITELHGGDVSIDCGEEGGTTVRLAIPTAPSTH